MPYSHLKIGGPAEFLIQPRTIDELRAVLVGCHAQKVPVRMLGGGNNLLIRDDPIRGAVIRLTSAPFTVIEWDGKRITAAGGGALLTSSRSRFARNSQGLKHL